MSMVLTWLLVGTFIYVNKEDKSENKKTFFLELHLFCSNDLSNSFVASNISFQMLEE